MYVCLCNQVTDRDIESAVADGAASLADLQERLNVATCCGTCTSFAEDLLFSAITNVANGDQDLGYAAAC